MPVNVMRAFKNFRPVFRRLDVGVEETIIGAPEFYWIPTEADFAADKKIDASVCLDALGVFTRRRRVEINRSESQIIVGANGADIGLNTDPVILTVGD